MDNLQRVQNGDLSQIQKSSNLALISQKNLVGDIKDLQGYNIPMVKDKLLRDQERIQQLKSQVRQAELPINRDDDEIYRKKTEI